VYYLKAVPWQVPDFTVGAYRDRLFALHERIETEGGLRVPGQLFYLEAARPRDCRLTIRSSYPW